jgi:hypothetical protein
MGISAVVNSVLLALLLLLSVAFFVEAAQTDNINGVYKVATGRHYANKTGFWGQNSELDWSVTVSMGVSCALYNSSATCDDPAWYGDWNKLWGKTRCGYMHDNHKDSDRFVWRRCSDPTCALFVDDGVPRVALAAYSYDNGVAPYTQEGGDLGLLQPFSFLLLTDTPYQLRMQMDAGGKTTFSVSDATGAVKDTVEVQHATTCPDDFFKGTVNGLYFGGDCTAPEDVLVTYSN